MKSKSEPLGANPEGPGGAEEAGTEPEQEKPEMRGSKRMGPEKPRAWEVLRTKEWPVASNAVE